MPVRTNYGLYLSYNTIGDQIVKVHAQAPRKHCYTAIRTFTYLKKRKL